MQSPQGLQRKALSLKEMSGERSEDNLGIVCGVSHLSKGVKQCGLAAATQTSEASPAAISL